MSQALSAFQADLEARGVADRVLTFVWSEFGRRPQRQRLRHRPRRRRPRLGAGHAGAQRAPQRVPDLGALRRRRQPRGDGRLPPRLRVPASSSGWAPTPAPCCRARARWGASRSSDEPSAVAARSCRTVVAGAAHLPGARREPRDDRGRRPHPAAAKKLRTTAVGVGLREYRIALYRSRVLPGRVRLNLENLGEDGHDLRVIGPTGTRTIRALEPGAQARRAPHADRDAAQARRLPARLHARRPRGARDDRAVAGGQEVVVRELRASRTHGDDPVERGYAHV